MSQTHFEALVTLALLTLPIGLRASILIQSLTQLYCCYPLVGCGITQADGSTLVIAVGRN